MRGLILLILFFAFRPSSIGQITEEHYITVGLLPAQANICKGQTVTLDVAFNCACGIPRWLNTRFLDGGNCVPPPCIVTGNSTPTIVGGDIQSQTTIPTPGDCMSPEYYPSCTVAPSQTSTYSISWDKIEEHDEYHCASTVVPAKTVIWHYYGEATVVVDEVPVPSLNATKTRVKPGEKFILTVDNCDADGQMPDYHVRIKEKCASGVGGLYSCSNNAFTFTAPPHPTTLSYKAKMVRDDPPWCESDWSGSVDVIVENVPDPNACGDANIASLEQNLSNLNASILPKDYHFFPITTLLCNTSNPSCNTAQLWSKYISSSTYSQPQMEDMPLDRFLGLGAPTAYSGGNQSANNCDDYNIYSTVNTFMKSIPWMNSPVGAVVSAAIELACPEFLTGYNIQFDPIKVVIDPQATCVTRYTKPGHILFPGKTTTCIYEDDCGNVYLRTLGEGLHFCGDNVAGGLMAKLNNLFGDQIFTNNHKRFKSASGF